jgi:hypothetical protein
VGKVSKLEELIAEYCPDGVEYVKIEDICIIISSGEYLQTLPEVISTVGIFHGYALKRSIGLISKIQE